MTTSDRNIQAGEATVDTVSVTLQAVRVNNKAMTISVFKQLPDWPSYREVDFTIWGYVQHWHDNTLYWLLAVKDGRLWKLPASRWTAEQHPQLFIAV